MRSKSHQVPLGLWQYKIDLAVAGAKDLLTHVPEIKAIGLTGSVAWGDVGADDDLDYLIVTSARRVFTVRWGCYWRAIKMGKKRRFGSERDSFECDNNVLCMCMFADIRQAFLQNENKLQLLFTVEVGAVALPVEGDRHLGLLFEPIHQGLYCFGKFFTADFGTEIQ